jgi:hypothetical protein
MPGGVRHPRPSGGYGSISGFTTAKAARDYADDLESDRRRGRWLDPDGAKTTVAQWAARWVDTLDVETRTEENYRASLRNHILPVGEVRRWATQRTGVGDGRARAPHGRPSPHSRRPSAGLLVITAAWTGCRWENSPAYNNATTSICVAARSPSTRTPAPCANPHVTSGSARRRHPPPPAPSPCPGFSPGSSRCIFERAEAGTN